MKTDHVAIEMEEKPCNKNWKVIQMNEDIQKSKEDMKPRSSLKSYYLGCSCVICYRRYKCSKKPHSCNAKDRCHVVHKERIEDLEAFDTGEKNTTKDMLPPTTVETECELNIEHNGDFCKVCIFQSYTPTINNFL